MDTLGWLRGVSGIVSTQVRRDRVIVEAERGRVQERKEGTRTGARAFKGHVLGIGSQSCSFLAQVSLIAWA